MISTKGVSICSCPAWYLNVGMLPWNWETCQRLINWKRILEIKGVNGYILFGLWVQAHEIEFLFVSMSFAPL